MDKQDKRYQIILTFKDKDLANSKYSSLIKSQIGFTIETKVIELPRYCIVGVGFGENSQTYTYRLSDSLAENISKGKASSIRSWPTKNGAIHGVIRSMNWLTEAEINEYYGLGLKEIRYVEN